MTDTAITLEIVVCQIVTAKVMHVSFSALPWV